MWELFYGLLRRVMWIFDILFLIEMIIKLYLERFIFKLFDVGYISFFCLKMFLLCFSFLVKKMKIYIYVWFLFNWNVSKLVFILNKVFKVVYLKVGIVFKLDIDVEYLLFL